MGALSKKTAAGADGGSILGGGLGGLFGGLLGGSQRGGPDDLLGLAKKFI